MIVTQERRGFMVEDIVPGDIIWRNFAGEATRFKAAGDRKFHLKFNQEGADFFEEHGVTGVKDLKFDPEFDDEPMSQVPVSVKFGDYPPEIYIVNRGRKTRLTEETVGMLDRARIIGGDMYLNPWTWSMPGGKSGTKLFLKKAYFEIELDRLDDKYADLEDQREDSPF